MPDGWSFSAGVDTPLKHISKPQFSSGYQYLFIPANGAGVGPSMGVTATTGIPTPDGTASANRTASANGITASDDVAPGQRPAGVAG